MPMKYWLTAFLILMILSMVDTYLEKKGGAKYYPGWQWIAAGGLFSLIFGLVGLVTFIWTLE